MGYYDAIAESYDNLYGEEQINKLRLIKNNIKIGKNTRILDLGCGTGISSEFGCFVVGIDTSFGMLKHNKKLKVFGTAECLPFKTNSLDYIISVTSLHNFNNIKNSINEAKRAGKGRFIFSILKKSKKYCYIKKFIDKNFIIYKTIEEQKDTILFCSSRLACCILKP